MPGRGSALPWWLSPTREAVYFSAVDPEHGRELWKSDGTEAGTVLVKDIKPGPGWSSPEAFTEVGDIVYFTTRNRGKLWRTDGTESGTVMLRRPTTVGGLTAAGDKVYFSAQDDEHGQELWMSDGTAAGTQLVKDICPGRCHGYAWEITPFGSHLFFYAQNRRFGEALWKTDGTPEGTEVVQSFCPGPGPPYDCFPQELTVVGDTLFFTAFDVEHGRELWKSDGTPNGTSLVADIQPGPAPDDLLPYADLTAVGDSLLFHVDDGSHGNELWSSDGTEDGTRLIKDIAPGEAGSVPSNLVDVGGTLFFIADDQIHGDELWKSDGTEAGTLLVSDIVTGRRTPFPYFVPFFDFSFTAVGRSLYFLALDRNYGKELWTSDGTETGTALVFDLFQGARGSAPREMTSWNGRLFFAATAPDTGRELWGLVTTRSREPRCLQTSDRLRRIARFLISR